MKRITGFMAALFLVLGFAAAGFAQDDTMTKQNDKMMDKKPMMKKHHKMMKKHHKMSKHHRHHKGKMMKKETTMK
jgi:preprotein translocase subunit SecG